MGLDLGLVRVPKDKTPSEIWNLPYHEFEKYELAYGRKTWTIYYFFRNLVNPPRDCEDYEISEENWDDFIVSFEALCAKHGGIDAVRKLAEWSTFYYYEEEEDEEEEELSEEEEESRWDQIRSIVEDWDDDVLYQLGADWELRTLFRWYDANDEIRKAFASGDKVYFYGSY